MFHLHTTDHSAATYSHSANQTESIRRLAGLSRQNQWILFTAECPRPSLELFVAYKVSCNNIVHMKPSKTLPEMAIVEKAIKSGNASAVVASGNISLADQQLLTSLANQHHCEVFFIDKEYGHYH
ncbi:cell division inhibitor SulA [Vibrio zhanjiangensis]|uniref:Cell division inhibitor SulA n=1 Tax=Vibrio zhanjiangensis TaxID=1046128 RepID=A0ABQ6F3E6_9VIBR|nr:hypothetical protein [Vibrio zhanjiangensis]GLT19380.1 cell division inhibitor SulA [Vibrio zhanjiangensis]